MARLDLRAVYDFEVYPSSILGNTFKCVTVLAYLDYESAVQQFADIHPLHTQIYPLLPVGTSNDPRQYNYYKLKLPNGSTTIIGETWINDSTVQKITSRQLQVIIEDVNTSELDRVRAALIHNGFTNFSLNFVN